MNQFNKDWNLNIGVANQLRQNLADLAKDINATRQEKLVDSTLAQQEAAAASKAIEEVAKPKIKVELDPDSVDQIKAAVEAAMQGFSVPWSAQDQERRENISGVKASDLSETHRQQRATNCDARKPRDCL